MVLGIAVSFLSLKSFSQKVLIQAQITDQAIIFSAHWSLSVTYAPKNNIYLCYYGESAKFYKL